MACDALEGWLWLLLVPRAELCMPWIRLSLQRAGSGEFVPLCALFLSLNHHCEQGETLLWLWAQP